MSQLPIATLQRLLEDRRRLREDLYLFARNALGRDRLVPRIHRPWCADVARAERFQLWLCPRGSFKTTLFTEALPLWLLVRDPNLRILIASSTGDIAASFLRAIRAHLTGTRTFRAFFGNWLAGPFRKAGELWHPQRTRIAKEPTLATTGMDAEITSAHYDVIICDDLVSRRDRESPAAREKTRRYFRDLVSILEPTGRMIIIGTRWHHQDAYADLAADGDTVVRRYPAMDLDGAPLMPELYDRERLDGLRERIGDREFAAQYRLSPLPPEGTLFPLEKLAFYEPSSVVPDGWFVYADPSLGRSATSDYGAILAGFRHGESLCVDYARIERLPSSRFVPAYLEAIAHCLGAGGPLVRLGCESNAFQEYVLRELVKTLETQGRADLASLCCGLKPTGKKDARIESLEGPVAAGRIRFRSDWLTAYPKLLDCLLNWPQVQHDDPVDALEGLWRLMHNESVERGFLCSGVTRPR